MTRNNWPSLLKNVTDKTKALALICLIVNALFLASLPALQIGQRIYALLVCGVMLIVIAVGVILIELTEKRAHTPLQIGKLKGDQAEIPEGISALLNSSNWPMFFTDANRIVVQCNSHIGQLLDSSERDFEGRPVRVLIERLAQQVPELHRTAFLQRQGTLQEKYSANLHPHSDEFEYLDTTHHPVSNLWRGLYKLWIHADRITLNGREIGYFVMYHVEKIDRLPWHDTMASSA